ncbi:MAG: hypothetical protein AAFR61_10740 [Bacteroidota bacterium]
MNDKDLFDQVQDFLEGNLNEAESQAFQEALKQQPALAQELKKQQLAQRLLLETATLSWKQSLKPAASPRPSPFLRPINIAAAILVLASLGWIIWQNTRPAPQSLLAQYAEAYPAPNLRSTSQELDLFRQGAIAYQQADYAGAVTLWQNMTPAESRYDESQFYTSVALLMQQKAQAALPLLELLHQRKDPRFGQAIQWYLSLAYVDTQAFSSAIPLLQALADQASPYQARARRLLADIKKRSAP